MPQWLQQNPRLIIFALFVGFGLLNAIYNALAKQAKKKKEAEQRQRELDESLRTGRGIEPGGLASSAEAADPGRARREEIARKRREQLEELRRRAAAKAQGGSGPGLPAPQRPAQTQHSGGRPAVAGLDSAALERKKREEARAREAKKRDSAIREQTAVRAAAESRAQAEAQGRFEQQVAALRAGTQPTVEASAVAQSAGLQRGTQPQRGRRFTTSDLRRAIVMQELLAPPVSLRDEEAHERLDV